LPVLAVVQHGKEGVAEMSPLYCEAKQHQGFAAQ